MHCKPSMRFCSTILFLVLPLVSLYGQEVESSLLSKKQQQQDLRQVIEAIEHVHPGIYDFHDEQSWENQKASAFLSISDSVSIGGFYPALGELVSSLKCGHTVVEPSSELQRQLREHGRLLPLSVKYIGGKYYIWQNLGRDFTLKKGQEIKAINGQSMDTLIKKLKTMIPLNGQGNLRIHGIVEEHLGLYHALCFGEQENYTIAINDTILGDTTFNIRSSTKKQMEAMSILRYGQKPKYPPVEMEISQKLGIGLLKVNTFDPNWYDRARINYADTLNHFFRLMNQNKLDKLIIDLRDNKGGSRGYTNILLSHFMEEAFQDHHHVFIQSKNPYGKGPVNPELLRYFKGKKTKMEDGRFQIQNSQLIASIAARSPQYSGKIFLLVNRNTFSAASHLASILRQHKKGFILGEQTAGFDFYSNAGFFYNCKLKNSGYVVKIPYFQSWYFNDLNSDKSLLKPDVYLSGNLGALLKDEDPVLQQAINYALSSK